MEQIINGKTHYQENEGILVFCHKLIAEKQCRILEKLLSLPAMDSRQPN